MSKIRVALVGVGNCASSLVQGVAYYAAANQNETGLMHSQIGGYSVSDIEFVLAYDIDRRKVGQDVATAIFAKPNCTAIFCSDVPATGAKVQMGRILDGIAGHMESGPADRAFARADAPEPTQEDVVAALT